MVRSHKQPSARASARRSWSSIRPFTPTCSGNGWSSINRTAGLSTRAGPAVRTVSESGCRSLTHRAMIKAVLDGTLSTAETYMDPIFNLEVPTTCPNVPEEVLKSTEHLGQQGRLRFESSRTGRAIQEELRGVRPGYDRRGSGGGPQSNYPNATRRQNRPDHGRRQQAEHRLGHRPVDGQSGGAPGTRVSERAPGAERRKTGAGADQPAAPTLRRGKRRRKSTS